MLMENCFYLYEEILALIAFGAKYGATGRATANTKKDFVTGIRVRYAHVLNFAFLGS